MHSLTSAPFSYRAGNSFVMVEYISPGMRRMSDCTTRAQYSASSCKVDSREIPFRKRKQGGKRLEGSERYVSGINIQILDAKLNQEEGPCSGSFTRNINSHGRGVFAFRNGHLILPSVFTGLFMIMRTNCPRDQTRLYQGRPRSVFCFPIVRLTRPSQFGTTTTSSYLFHSLPLHLQPSQPSDGKIHQTKGQSSKLSQESAENASPYAAFSISHILQQALPHPPDSLIHPPQGSRRHDPPPFPLR